MAQKPKTRKPPSKANAAEKQKAQSERFIKAAREAGVDETGKDFDSALKKLIPTKRRSVREKS